MSSTTTTLASSPTAVPADSPPRSWAAAPHGSCGAGCLRPVRPSSSPTRFAPLRRLALQRDDIASGRLRRWSERWQAPARDLIAVVYNVRGLVLGAAGVRA